jgi:FKBP-type peptidyl-prolyl cis-trans isomerase
MRLLKLAAALLIATLSLAACDSNDDPDPVVEIEEIAVGMGAVATAADTVRVAYTGRLLNDLIFDQSEDATFPLSGVIPGFRDGIVGMREGGERRITIPSELGYGSRGVPQARIPPNATLVFDVELLEVNPQ